MKNTDFSNIELSIYQKFVMRTLPLLKSGFFYRENILRELEQYGFIRKTPQVRFGHMCFGITPQGKMYFRVKRKTSVRFWIPVIISVIALLKSYDVLTIPLISEALQGLGSLLKTIVESLGIFR